MACTCKWGLSERTLLSSLTVALSSIVIFLVRRVQTEVDEVLGNKTDVSVEDLEKLEYMEQVSIVVHLGYN